LNTLAFKGFLPFGHLIPASLAEHRGLAPALLALGGGVLLSASVAATVALRQ